MPALFKYRYFVCVEKERAVCGCSYNKALLALLLLVRLLLKVYSHYSIFNGYYSIKK